MTAELLLILLPEIVLAAAGVGICLGGAFARHRRQWHEVALAGLAVAAWCLYRFGGVDQFESLKAAAAAGLPWLPPIVITPWVQFARWFTLGMTGLLLAMRSGPGRAEGEAEYVGSLLLLAVGVMLAVSAEDLVLLFVALELVSIPTYLVLGIGRTDAQGREAALKYFVLSVIASSILVYGFAFLYGAAGSTRLPEMAQAFAAGVSGRLVALGLTISIVALAFRLTAVPMHFYAPDVYQGTSAANGALLSVAPKAAGFFVLGRLLFDVVPVQAELCWRLFFALAVCSMTLANVLGLRQADIRRMLAYSSIAQSGYMLVGLCAALAARGGAGGAADWNGAAAVLFYLVVYAVATIGVFAGIAALEVGGRRINRIDQLAGAAYSRPGIAAAMAVCLFSLTGLPPLAGFWGKLFLFGSALAVAVDPAMDAGTAKLFTALAIIGVLNAAVAAAYYLRVAAVMYFQKPASDDGTNATSPRPAVRAGDRITGPALTALLAALLVIGFGVSAGLLHEAARSAAPAATIAPPPIAAMQSPNE